MDMLSSQLVFVEASRMQNRMDELSKDCISLDMAVAFLSREGYSIIEPNLLDLISRGSDIRIALGLSNNLRITDKDAVHDLLKLSKLKSSNNHLSLKFFDNPGFHPKLAIFGRRDGTIDVVIGSSNLTRGGQRDNTEANVLIRAPPAEFQSVIQRFYEGIWKVKSEDLAILLKKYKGRRKEFDPQIGKKSTGALTKLPPPLEDESEKHVVEEIMKIRKWWRIAPGSQGVAWLGTWDEPQGAWRAGWYFNIKDMTDGIVSIGWDSLGDLDSYNEDFDRLRVAMKRAAKQERWRTFRKPKKLVWKTPRALEKRLDTVANFAGWQNAENPVKINEGVIAYNEGCVYGIGKIIGRYEHKEDLPRFTHTRRVRWFKYTKTPPKATRFIIDALGRPGTLRQVTDTKSVNKAILELKQWT